MDETKGDIPTVDEIGKSLQSFGVFDYAVFVGMLLSCCLVGVYHAFKKHTIGENEYLVGGRNMSIIPVSMSLIASFISGISLLGIPTEIYVYGTSYFTIFFSLIFTGWIMSHVYLPVFHEMKLTSTYEYLERRFDKKLRIFGSTLFSLGIMIWLPIVIYVPALAFNQVTGINVHIITPFVCLVCIFYTCVGGLKAVVWADFIQGFIMFATMILISIKGTMDLGGLSVVLRRNLESGRIEFPSTNMSPLVRHTLWSLLIGGAIHNLNSSAVNQNMVQRYLALPNLKAARKALWIFIGGIFVLNIACVYAGLLIYAWYHECDPLTTKLAQRKDQLLPLLVMNVLGNIPGLPGLFVSAVFSAALSSLSTGLNSMAAVVLEDFIKPFRKKSFTAKQAENLMKLTVLFLGALCTGLVFVVEKAGSHVLQLSMSLSSIVSGPSLAIFTMGVLIPWINGRGALIGGLSGLSFMAWVCISAETAISTGKMSFDMKPTSIDGCTYAYQKTENQIFFIPPETVIESADSETLAIFRMSYLWYTVTGFIISVSVSLVASIFTSSDMEKMDPILLAPFIRKYLKPVVIKPYNDEQSQVIDTLLSKETRMEKITTKT